LLQALSKLALRAQTVESAILPLRLRFISKKHLNERSKGFWFEQQPLKGKPHSPKMFSMLHQFFLRPLALCDVTCDGNYFFAITCFRSLVRFFAFS